MPFYTSVALVEREFKAVTFGSASAVSSEDVAEFIKQEEAILNGELGVIYDVPVTASAAVLIVRKMATIRVKARVLDILPVKVGKSEAEQGGSSSELKEMIQKMVDSVKKREMSLDGATLKASATAVKSYTADNEIDPVFEKDTDNW